jgi:hypothetical protein
MRNVQDGFPGVRIPLRSDLGNPKPWLHDLCNQRGTAA